MSEEHSKHHIPEDQSGTPKPKRQKVTIACDECRSKKIKCDGVRPVCQPCHRKYGPNTSCEWSVSTGRGGGISKDYIMQLEDRIRELEANPSPNSQHITFAEPPRPSSHAGLLSDSPNYPTQAQPSGGNTWSAHARNNGMKHDFSSTSSPAMQSTYNSQPFSQPPWQGTSFQSTTDPNLEPLNKGRSGVVSAMTGAVLDEPQSQGFFGGSSAGSFIKQVRKAIDNKIESPQGVEPSNSVLDQIQLSMLVADGKSRQKSNLNYVLPPRQVADSLMALYWKIVYPLYPYVDRYEIETAYLSLWTGHHDEPIFLCISNIIFALSCQLSDTIKPEQREASAHVFFVRARETLNFNVWQAGSIQSVQAFLLLAQYLQSTNEPHQCWIVVGLAIRTAQSLGIHLPETSEGVSSPRTRELLRKVWHGCVLMDRFLSMTYGRPAMIGRRSAAAVPLPAAVDEHSLSRDPDRRDSQPEDNPSILEFFIQSLTLYRILNEILLNFYAADPHPGTKIDQWDCFFPCRDDEQRSCSFLDLDRALTVWERELPLHLNVSNHANSSDVHFRQAVVLRQRIASSLFLAGLLGFANEVHKFLHVKVLLLRPFLSRFVTSPNTGPEDETAVSGSLPYRIALQCSIVCVKTAQDAIEHIHSRLPTDPNDIGPLAAWWFNVLFVYTAATVLVAARLRSAICSEITEVAIAQSWQHAIEILNRYEAFGASAQRVVATLQVLYDKVPERYLQYRIQPQADDITMEGAQHAQSGTESVPGIERQSWNVQSPWSQNNKVDTTGLTLTQTARTETSLGYFNNFDFNFDVNDVSWLDTVPFYQT